MIRSTTGAPKSIAGILCVLVFSWAGHQAHAQMQWWPTEVGGHAGAWLAEGDMQDAVDGSPGVHAAWMTKATNGWAAFGGIEHQGFVGMPDCIGLRMATQAGWADWQTSRGLVISRWRTTRGVQL